MVKKQNVNFTSLDNVKVKLQMSRNWETAWREEFRRKGSLFFFFILFYLQQNRFTQEQQRITTLDVQFDVEPHSSQET